jgi:hypothetical protein
VLDIGGDRNRHGARDPRDRLDHLARRHNPAVRISKGSSDASARRRNGRKPFRLEEARAHGVPRIRQHQNRRPMMEIAEQFGFIDHVG